MAYQSGQDHISSAYAPILWHMPIQDRTLKSLYFHYSEIFEFLSTPLLGNLPLTHIFQLSITHLTHFISF